MKLSVIALKLRTASTSFGSYIAGAAELAVAMKETLKVEAAFVVPMNESASPNQQDSGYYQDLNESFGVVVALKNDTSKYDQIGLTAYDRLHEIRAEIFDALLNWVIPGAEYPVTFTGGRLLDLNPAWMWYLFEFTYKSHLDKDDCIDEDETGIDYFTEIYTQYVVDNALRPLDGLSLPAELTPPSLSQLIDVEFGFSSGFSVGFNTIAAFENK